MATILTSYNNKNEIVSKYDVSKFYPKGRNETIQLKDYKLVYTTIK